MRPAIQHAQTERLVDSNSNDDVPPGPHPRVCHFGSFPTSPEYGRNRAIASALEAAGWSVIECRVANRASAGAAIRRGGGFSSLLRLAADAFRRFGALARQHRHTPEYDAMVVGYPAHIDILLAYFLTRLRRRPLVMDAFLGLYDSAVRDRGMIAVRHPMAIALWGWEWLALRLPDAVLVDTPEHAHLLSRDYSLGEEHLIDVPVGIDEELWQPDALPPLAESFRVFSWGTFIPLHGMHVVAAAAARLADSTTPISLQVIGDGQTASEFADALPSSNTGARIEWQRGFVDLALIRDAAQRAHCCLGIFGASAKAERVIPYKVCEALALGRPVITADTPASRRVLEDGASALLIPADSPQALAAAIDRLARDRSLCERLALGGRRAYEEHLSGRAMSDTLGKLMNSLTGRPAGAEPTLGPTARPGPSGSG